MEPLSDRQGLFASDLSAAFDQFQSMSLFVIRFTNRAQDGAPLRQKPDGSHLHRIGVRAYAQMPIWPKNKKKNKVGLPSLKVRF